MKALLLGMGEVGGGIYDICKNAHTVVGHDPCKGIYAKKVDCHYPKIDVLLVAIPYAEGFVGEVNHWREQTEPDATIIFSTVPIGTTERIQDAVHFPVEALHPNIAHDLILNDKLFMGGISNVASIFLQMTGLKFRVLGDPRWTEFLKLRSTAIYGVNIEFARYSKQVADELAMDYTLIREYDEAHNKLNLRRGTPQYQRYILSPPEGNIGGHCVVPNARLLHQQFPYSGLAEILTEREESDEQIAVLTRLREEAAKV